MGLFDFVRSDLHLQDRLRHSPDSLHQITRHSLVEEVVAQLALSLFADGLKLVKIAQNLAFQFFFLIIALLVALSKTICEVDFLFFSLFQYFVIVAHNVHVQKYFILRSVTILFGANFTAEIDEDFFGDGIWEVCILVLALESFLFFVCYLSGQLAEGK